MSKAEVYTIADVAKMTGFSRNTITRLFEREPGVLVLDRPERKHKRGSHTAARLGAGSAPNQPLKPVVMFSGRGTIFA